MLKWFPIPFRQKARRVSVLRLQGVISASGGRGGISHASFSPLIEKAFRKGKPDAVALAINSPGGSPVQSALIGAQIRRLAEETSCPVHAFVEDVAASGGYWLAAAADDIWVDDSSITGSIGVISSGFGFHELLARSGIERRVHTAGEDKSMLDPFRPERAEDVERLKTLQAQIHDHFISHVKTRRGDRLRDDQDLFTGEIFVGAQAVELGLVDGVAHMVPKLKALYGDKVRLTHHGQRRPLLQRLLPGIVTDALQSVENHAAWARFGL
ncbi:S49 family peptidase [Jannaschia faecimaris]|nr:S49 family peptidase [Jannaschia faecimaris]